MDSLRRITEQINVFVRFFQSINCLFLQLGWLERNIVHGSVEKIVLTLVLVLVAGYVTFGCSGLSSGRNLCSEENMGTLIVLLVLGIIAYFFYKRFNQGASIASAAIVEDEGDKLIPSVPAYREMEMGQMGQRLSKSHW
ncbi:hypothetical protein B484DRAFT_445833 [Ochromonadaceae sp. CCMP2298]|nr:hypothetical protein B484DRAFT_445833 [Ochromonadaceae sp. CCMP2298]|mmetsp:Transcript_7880/g.17166  ORF Transcript_7880/g.17166 Transcript_7880/m.17166 type:complete len:139 (-) Transcript_7880:147-563(-)